MSAYDDLSERARWFLENFSELDLAEICADQEARLKATNTQEATAVTVPLAAFDRLVTVAAHVSLGRSAAFNQDHPYPDAAARAGLGALHDTGLLDDYRHRHPEAS